MAWRPLENSCGSDHLPIITIFHLEYNLTGTVPQSKWKLNAADWDRFRQLYSDTLKIVENTSIDRVSEGFTEILSDICGKTIPKTKPKPGKTRPPWWDNEITTMVRAREHRPGINILKRTEERKQAFNQ